MSIQEILTGGGGLLVILLTIVQIAPVKINPWSKVAKALGRAINADVLKDLDEVKKGQRITQGRLDDHIKMDDRRTADGHRMRILHFNNELLRNINHTKEEFIEALVDIDAYEKYCEENPDYPNNRAVLAIENIREVYKERLKKHDFLQEGSSPRREQTP